MLKIILSSIIRHFATGAGGALVLEGVISGEQLNAAIGAVALLGNTVYSVYKNLKKASEEAKTEKPVYNK